VEGDPLSYDLNATDHSGIDKFWMIEHPNFDITDEGVVANTTNLIPDTYDLAVKVNDTLGYTQNGTLTVKINAAPTTTTTTTTTSTTQTTTPGPTPPPSDPIPLELVAMVIAIPLVLIIVLVVWRSRR
jgi:hypothetical protein